MKQGIFLKLTACLLVYPNLVYTAIVLAETPRQAGVVTTLNGEATLTRATRSDQPLALKFRDEVFYKDRIRTKANSVARVLLGGKAVVTIRALSDLIITEEPQHPVVVYLSSGKIALDVARSRMKPGEVIEVHTPNAFAALRGTMIVVEVLPASGETGTPAVDDGVITYEPLRTASTESALPVLVPNVITNFYVLQGSIDVTSLGRPGAPPVTLGPGLSLSAIGPSLGQPRPNPPPSQLLTDLKATPQHTGIPDEAKKSVSEKHHKTATALAEAIVPKKDADKAKEEKSKDDKGKEDKAKEEKAKEDKDKEEKVILSPPPPPPPPPSPTTNVILPTTGTTTQTTGTTTQTTQLVIPPDQAINTPQTFSTVSLSAPGTLSGDATVTATGLLTWTGGTMAGAGITQAQGEMAITGNVTLNRMLNNAGPGDIQGDFMIAGTGTLNNSNTLTKSIGSGRATIATPFNSSGMVDVQSGTLVLSGTVTNNGMLKAESGTTLTVSSSLTNLSGGTLTGGTYDVLGTMKLPGNITTNAAAIVLDGASSLLLNTPTGTDALVGFTTNASGGSFTIQNGRSFTTAAAFSNAGNVTIGTGSTFTVPGGNNYTQTAGSTTANGALNVTGTTSISGGTLTVTGDLTNTTGTGAILTVSGGSASLGRGLALASGASLTPTDPMPSVTGTVPIGHGPAKVAITPDGSRAYITNIADIANPTVSVIDTATRSVIATISMPPQPDGIAITPDGTRVYVTSLGSPGEVSVIDTATNTVIGSPLTVGNVPPSIAITPDGTRAYVTNALSNTVSVIDTATKTVTATVSVGAVPDGIAITPDGARAYVANFNSNTVSIIETASNTVVATTTAGVGSNPRGIAIAPNGTRVYVANNGSNTVSVIDIATNTVVATVGVGLSPFGVAVSPDSTRVYVANRTSASVSIINTATNAVVATVGVGANPTELAITPDGASAYVVNSFSDNAFVIGGVTSPLFQVTGGTLTVTGNLVSIPTSATLTLGHTLLNVINGGSVKANTDVVNVAGTLDTGGAPLLDLRGRGSATASETVEGNTLTLGTDRPLRGPGTCPSCPLAASLVSASGATVTTNQAVRLDTALLEATAPLINLMNHSSMTSNSDLVNLANQAKLVGNVPGDALIKLNASTLNVTGSLFNVAGGSYLKVTGSLFSLTNTSTLNINSGWLVNVSGGSVFTLTGGSLGLFGSGMNTLNISNNAPLCSGCSFAASGSIPNLNTMLYPVLLANGASASNISVKAGFTPFAPIAAGNTVNVNVSGTSGAVLALSGATSKVKLGF